jgi:LysM repeat protein
MVIIDAGHGGSDPGGGSNEYWLEKDLNLKISLYQYNRLKSLGVPVSLTRDSDITLNPNNRVNKVFSLGGAGDILISNHVNIDYGNLDGAEVIYSIKDDRRLARIIAENLRVAGQNLSPNGIYTRTNEYGNDYYYIIRNIRPIQGVLIEYGFADSKGDDIALLRNRWFDLAESVVKSVCEFLGYKYVPISGFEAYEVKKGDTLFSVAKKYGMTVAELKGINGLSTDTIYPGNILLVFPQTPTGQTITYVVSKGDTLFNIAKKFGTSVTTIKSANALTNDNLSIGQQLIIPITFRLEEYVVSRGDTLYSVANKLGVSIELIKILNNLKSNTIYPNQSLLIPKI